MANITASHAGSFGLLPNEANYMILKRLDKKNLFHVSLTCKAMYTLCREGQLWKPIRKYADQFFVSKQLLADCKQAPLDKRTSYLNLAVAINAPHSVIREFFQAQVVPDRKTMLVALSRRKNLTVMQDIQEHCDASNKLGFDDLRNASIVKNLKAFALKSCHGFTTYPSFKLQFVYHIIQSVKHQENWETAFYQKLHERLDCLQKFGITFDKDAFVQSIKRLVIGSYPSYLSFTQRTQFLDLSASERSYKSYAEKYQEECNQLNDILKRFQSIEPILEEADKLLEMKSNEMDIAS